MKKTTLYILMVIGSYTFVPSFAQDGTLEDEYGNHYTSSLRPRDYGGDMNFFNDDDPGSGEEGGGSVEDPEAPINAHLPILLLAGVGLGWYFYRRRFMEDE